MTAFHDSGHSCPIQGGICATPGCARPYAVVLRREQVIVRSEPVETLEEAERVLRRLWNEAALEWSSTRGGAVSAKAARRG